MFTPAATQACTASWPEWKKVPSPMFWNRWGTSVNGAWPIHWLPSPPIWVSPVTALSVRPDIVTMVWQPIPPPARDPSGTAVERLCGQPLQKYAARLAGSTSSDSAGGGGFLSSSRSSSTRRSGASRRPAVSSPPAGISSRPAASFLPMIRGAPARP